MPKSIMSVCVCVCVSELECREREGGRERGLPKG